MKLAGYSLEEEHLPFTLKLGEQAPGGSFTYDGDRRRTSTHHPESLLPELRRAHFCRHTNVPSATSDSARKRVDSGLAVWGTLALIATLASACSPETQARTNSAESGGYEDLVSLFQEWRTFEAQPLRDGVADYTEATQAAREERLHEFQRRLGELDPAGWSRSEEVDYHVVRAEMNGLEFHLTTLRPWARDPAFYASVRSGESDTPAEEGPTIHSPVRLWQYSIWPRTNLDEPEPLSEAEEEALGQELSTIAPLLTQARENLAGSNTRDLWMGAIRAFENQEGALERLLAVTTDAGPDLRARILEALEATRGFSAWLRVEAERKTGPSGIGRDAYTWHLQNVLLVPMTWEDEVTVLTQELARAQTALRLEEHRNRNLPEMHVAQDSDEYLAMHRVALDKYMRFLDEQEILAVEDWMHNALHERTRAFLPPERRTFFHQIRVREPMGLWTHWYHWWDLWRLQNLPHASPIRQEALRYNVWMSRAEGMATAMEEWMMHAGLYDDNPRARELVWIMLAARAARGLASLRAHANEWTMAEAGAFHHAWTPRGWMRPDLDLLGFEQHLYLRQPGYGSSYITGARLMDELLTNWATERGDSFSFRDFFRTVDEAGMIPVSLLQWELTGLESRLGSPGHLPPN